MLQVRYATALIVLLAAAGLVCAAEVPFQTAMGKVDKADKDSLTIQPRGADGKFQKAMTLKLTGTSKLHAVSTRMQGGKAVLVQREIDAKDLEAKQEIAVIYAVQKDGNVLLSAVVQPPEK